MNAPRASALEDKQIVLAIDIGGSHVKMLTSDRGEERRVDSGPTMTALQMVEAVKTLADGMAYDVISIGYPGPVKDNMPLRDPAHLGPGWAGHDFSDSFGKPAKVVNDALMQAIGSYEGGRMLFLGLGTGLGTAMIVENVTHPLAIGHLPYKKGLSFEDYVGEPYLEGVSSRPPTTNPQSPLLNAVRATAASAFSSVMECRTALAISSIASLAMVRAEAGVKPGTTLASVSASIPAR
jgi:hypothetical protein